MASNLVAGESFSRTGSGCWNLDGLPGVRLGIDLLGTGQRHPWHHPMAHFREHRLEGVERMQDAAGDGGDAHVADANGGVAIRTNAGQGENAVVLLEMPENVGGAHT